MLNDPRSSQLRLLLEELCCDLCVFEAARGGCAPRDVRVRREYPLGRPGAFADIRVELPGGAAYFLEVKHGYPLDLLEAHLRRKYAATGASFGGARRLILVLDDSQSAVWERGAASGSRAVIDARLAVEIWNEKHLLRQLGRGFGLQIESISEANLLDVREAVDRAKGYIAFGGSSPEAYQNDRLAVELLWHFDYWRLREIREGSGRQPRQILPPEKYEQVAVVFADLCSFTSFVRDTPNDNVVRHCLTSFYSKARHQIIGEGGMLYQIVGDAVVGLFGLPDRTAGYVGHALRAARGLLSIGASVTHHWQRHIDHAQSAGGLRVGLALGDLQLVSLRPFSRSHMGVIGDAINIAARLQAAARPEEIVASNVLFNQLGPVEQEGFEEMAPVEARNLGCIQAWRLPAGVAA